MNDHSYWMPLLGLTFLIGMVFGLLLIAYEDGVAFGLSKKLSCKFGKHKFHIKIKRIKIQKYYCQNCKIKRHYPKLDFIQGGNKFGNFKY